MGCLDFFWCSSTHEISPEVRSEASAVREVIVSFLLQYTSVYVNVTSFSSSDDTKDIADDPRDAVMTSAFCGVISSTFSFA